MNLVILTIVYLLLSYPCYLWLKIGIHAIKNEKTRVNIRFPGVNMPFIITGTAAKIHGYLIIILTLLINFTLLFVLFSLLR